MADDKERTILLGLYTNVLSELKEITEFWTQKVPALPEKVAPLPDVSKEESNGKLYQTYKEHRDYLEELLGNYLEALQKSKACGDILIRLWDIKKKYKIPTKNYLDTDEADEKKRKFWRHMKVLDVIDKRLSEKQYEESQHRNAELKDNLIHLQEKEQEYKNIAERCNQSEQTNIELTEKMMHLQEKEQELIETIERQDKILKVPANQTKATIAQLQAELKKKQTELEKVTKNFKKVHKELTEERVVVEELKKEFTKLRELSKIAGSKMKDNNPSIVDLSDPNRPESLAEKYIEIYDNAWTDALDKLDEVTREGDSKCVQAILNVLKEIYNECKNEIDSRRRTMMELVGYDVKVLQKQMSPGGISEYDPNIKMCKDLIKSSARKINESVLKVVIGKTEVAELINLCGESAIKFVTNCTDLCIDMSVHDPPVVLDFSFQSGDNFDQDCLKAFTKVGNIIDYMVWPPMYLHNYGHLLSKGIAQGKSARKDRVIESKMSDQQPDQKTQGEPKEATAVRKATSSKMKDNDPSIADLGDPNRPHRLAETFKEIFENSWTDVLDKLDEVTREDESNNVKTILDVLKEIVNECKYQIDSRRKTLMEVLGYDVNVLQKQTCRDGKDKCDSNISICKDLIRSSAWKMKYPILEVIKRKTEVAKVIDLCGDIAIKFVTNCTDLCIHMSVHDPPVVFDFSFQRGDMFDKDCLYAFTKGGDVIDYMVWPPLYLHTDGPLLSKGIAQGRRRKDAQAAVLWLQSEHRPGKQKLFQK